MVQNESQLVFSNPWPLWEVWMGWFGVGVERYVNPWLCYCHVIFQPTKLPSNNSSRHVLLTSTSNSYLHQKLVSLPTFFLVSKLSDLFLTIPSNLIHTIYFYPILLNLRKEALWLHTLLMFFHVLYFYYGCIFYNEQYEWMTVQPTLPMFVSSCSKKYIKHMCLYK